MCVSWGLLVYVATGPRLHLPQGVHHGRVVARVRPLEALRPVRRRDYTTALGGVRLHPHMGSIRGIALGNVLHREKDVTLKQGDQHTDNGKCKDHLNVKKSGCEKNMD